MFKTLAFLILFFGGLVLVTLFEQNKDVEVVKGEKEEQNLVLGYCKTFERYALALAEENNLDVVKFGSSFEVLANLESGNIDYAVIGRRAYSSEISEEILEIPLEEYGWTLVSSEKGFLEYSELENLEIHTYLNEDEVLEFFSFEPNIVFHENIENALQGDLVLIHWEDFRDDFELVVPLVGDAKVEKFRNPMLYIGENMEPLEKLEVLVN
jgi:hypothetical protein